MDRRWCPRSVWKRGTTIRVCCNWFVLLQGLWLAGCGGGVIGSTNFSGGNSGGAKNVSVTISPQRAAVSTRGSKKFTAVVTNDPQNDGVVWSVDHAAGGNATVGQISRDGLYVAPVSGGIHTIVATSLVDPTKRGSAAIAVGAVMTDPTGDQTITGAHRLSLSDPASELLVRGKDEDGPGELALNQIFFNNYFGLSPQRRTTLLGESAANGYLVGTASEVQDTGNGALIGDYSVVLSENSNATPGNGAVVFAYEGDVTSNLAGGKILDAATSFSSGMDIEGDGTITTVSSFNEQGLAKNGTTVVHNNFGFSALKHAGIGDHLNAAFYAADQGVGPHDYAIYIAGGKNNLGPQGTSVGSLVVTKPHTPLSAFDTGTTGTIAWDSNFIYICVAPNTWRRAPISAW